MIINLLLLIYSRAALSPPQDPFSKEFKNPLYTASVSMLIFITTHY